MKATKGYWAMWRCDGGKQWTGRLCVLLGQLSDEPCTVSGCKCGGTARVIGYTDDPKEASSWPNLFKEPE